MVLKLYNSLEKRKKEFIPQSKTQIKIYTCGMTVYDHSHIGHARTYSSWDILIIYLRYRFPNHQILHVQNYTDVGHLTDDADEGEDKILKRAKRDKINPLELVDKYVRSFEDDIKDLNIKLPNISPRATGHILEMISFVEQLLEKGIAYETDNGIFFDIEKYPKYSELTNIKLEKQKTGARISEDKTKRNPFDFALFIKASKEHIMQWETPWGWKGYPGWHIECSTMAMKYLGDSLDIHAGGIEHLAIHHPNERAQTESLIGKNWVNFWLHANHMMLNGEKMSKSTGNLISTRNAIEKYGSGLLRYYLVVGGHYRSQDDFTEHKLLQKREEYQKIQTLIKTMEYLRKINSNKDIKISEQALKLKDEFLEEMDNDLNTVSAGKVLLNYVNYLNKRIGDEYNLNNKFSGHLFNEYSLFIELASLLAIEVPKINKLDQTIEYLIEIRKNARKTKQYEEADKIREKIIQLGYNVEDKPWGTIAVERY